MTEIGSPETIIANNLAKAELYKNPDYVSLYRYENPTSPYDKERDGTVSKEEVRGGWFTASLADLRSYTLTRVKGQRGGKFVVVRIPKAELEKYDASKNPLTAGMDIEQGNYVIPPDMVSRSRVEVDAIFKDNWEGRKNIPMSDWRDVENYINDNLSEEAIIERLTKT